MNLIEWLDTLSAPPGYPCFNKDKYRIEFWLGDKLLGWMNVGPLLALGDKWIDAYELFETKRLWKTGL